MKSAISSPEIFRALFAVIAFACFVSAPRTALAIDCSKAKTRIDTAICLDDELRQKDSTFSVRYFGALREAKESQFLLRDGKSLHDSLIATQRSWLSRRDEKCRNTAPDQLKLCIDDAITARWEELNAMEDGGWRSRENFKKGWSDSRNATSDNCALEPRNGCALA